MKKNLTATFLIVALSAIPLMAQNKPTDTAILQKGIKELGMAAGKMPGEMMMRTNAVSEAELMKYAQENQAIKQATYKDINQFVIDALKRDMESDKDNAEKYQTLINKYSRLLRVLEEENITVEQTVNGKTEIVLSQNGEQLMYIVLDDMAKAINNLPAEKARFYNSLIGTYNSYIFKALNKAVNISYLYDMAKGAISDNARSINYKSAISESPMVKEKPYAGPIIPNK